jgi:hypothetical protein
MTEQEWTEGSDLKLMLEFLWKKASDRKLRLFAATCCRRIWDLLDEYGQQAIEGAERFADGEADLDLRLTNRIARSADFPATANYPSWAAGYAGSPLMTDARIQHTDHPCWCAAKYARWSSRDVGREQERPLQVWFLRDIIGIPFSRMASDPTYRTATVVSLAQATYEERILPGGELDPLRLAVLADALEEIGAASDILHHLREPGPHVRGCWVIDALTCRS